MKYTTKQRYNKKTNKQKDNGKNNQIYNICVTQNNNRSDAYVSSLSMLKKTTEKQAELACYNSMQHIYYYGI